MISHNGDEVKRALQSWKGEPAAFVAALTRAVALEAVRRLVLKTPVDTGRARGNWQVGEGAPNTAITELVDPGGARINGELAAAIKATSGRQALFLTNSLPYIPVLEYGGYKPGPKVTAGGYSRQAPQGMIGVTLAELEAWAPDVVALVRIGGE